MAELVIRRQVDDLEKLRGNPGVDADESVIFAVGQVSYVVDLTEANAKIFREFLDEYVRAGRKLVDHDVEKALSPAAAKRTELREVRDWAARQGVHVSARGKVPKSILDAYVLAVGPLRHQ